MPERNSIARRLRSKASSGQIGLVVLVGIALAIGAMMLFAGVAGWRLAPPSVSDAHPVASPDAPVLHAAAVGDIHREGPSTVAAATAAEAAKADFILGLGDYQYEDGAMWKYCAYFDNDWGPNVPKMYPVLAPKHDQGWRDADPLKYFDGGGAHGYRSPVALKPYTPYSFDKGSWHFIALPDTCARTRGCRIDEITAWLQRDLAIHRNLCTIAFWHEPYFTSTGKHGPEVTIKPWVELLAANHVDVVLQAHNHFYERFAPQNAAREADPDGPQAFVVGTGGKGLHRLTHRAPNSVTRNDRTYGVLQVTLREDSYDWEFVPVEGGTYTDRGSMSCR